MTLKVRIGGATKTAETLRVQVGGALKPVVSGRIQVSGALKTFFAASASLTGAVVIPEARSAFGFDSTITSQAFTATPTGGVSPFTYLWSVDSYAGNLPTAVNPTSASSGFRQTGLAVLDHNDCVIRCTITDAIGTTAFDTADVSFERVQI